MELKEAIRHILDGNAVLFAGSGFSCGAVKDDGNTFSTATPLVHKLLEECGYDDEADDLGLASEIYKEMKGETALVDFIRHEFTAVNITLEQELIGSLPWKRIYTTNYDNVLEIAYQRNDRRLDSVVLSDRPQDYGDKSNLCVHLNGKVTSLSISKLNDEFKMTNSSYLTTSFLSSPWIKFFQTDLQTASAVFFIGYSMKYDLDIQRLVYANDELKKKTFFILRENESKVTQQLITRFGTPLTLGVKGLSEIIVDIKKDYIPQPPLLIPYICFKRHELGSTPPNILDKDVFNLYFRGDYGGDKNIFYSLQSPDNYPFCVYRRRLQQVLDVVEHGEQNILVHSSLGNGKTIFLTELATMLTHLGYSVYSFERYRATINAEIERICKSKNPTVIIFDRYADCKDYLDVFKNYRTDQILVVAERTAMNDIQYDKLEKRFGEFYHVDLNRLEDEEISQLVQIFNHYGLWSQYSSWKNERKFNFIASECHRSMAKFILKILKSPHILDSYKDTILGIRSKEKYYDAIIFILISQIAGFPVDMDDLVNAFDATQLNSPSFKNNPMIKEFLDFDGSTVRPMSSIVANVLLSKIFKAGVVTDVMINIFKQLNNLRSQKAVRQILRKMMIFSNLQQLLNKDDKDYKYNLIRFYEALKPLDGCADNPYFWLQYAILKLSEYDYQAAEVYFSNAYSYAKKLPNFDTYQIDNHHCRFLLENEIENGSQASCMKAFCSAHNILIDPRHREDAYYYPYRVAQKYYPFYEMFYAGMNDSEKKIFVSSCEAMLERTEWYLKRNSSTGEKREAVRAKDLLTKIIKEIESMEANSK